MSQASPADELWRLGIIAPWYLYDHQIPVYLFLEETHNPLFEASRRFGKTTIELVRVHEKCRRTESYVWRWAEPWKEQARNIVMPEMEKIQASCPKHLRAKFYRTDSFYEFPTGSRLYLVGVNEDRGESARGSFAHKITADELGSWKDPQYILNEVLLPQLLTTQGEIDKLGTPPKDLGHFWYSEKDRAIKEARYICRLITDNKSLTDEQIEAFIREMGGRNSTACRRELFCEPVSDPESLVIPEFDEPIHVVDDDYPYPKYFDAYVGMDLGLNDNTAVLFAYVDFLKRELVIDDEFVANGKNTQEIVRACRSREEALWGSKECRCALSPERVGPRRCMTHGLQPILRIADNEMQQLYDMQTVHGYTVSPTRKDDKLAAINALRLLFTEKRIKIKKRCRSTLYQLKVGLWNDRRTDYQRGEKTGHLDAIDALIYLSRNILWHHNPYPSLVEGANIYTHFIPDSGHRGEAEEQAFSALDPLGEDFG